jgi:hypothetical protein
MNEVKFWDAEDTEILTHTDQDDAIECLLDGFDELPDMLEIYGYTRMELPSTDSLTTHVLEEMLSRLDEDYGNPEDNHQEATDTMKEAAKAFVEIVKNEYVPWACEIVKHKTIDVQEWVKANRPDWLEQ